MDEKAKERLNELLVYLADGIEKGGEFVAEQAPLVAQEIIAFGRAYETTLACALFVAVAAAAFTLKRFTIPWALYADKHGSDPHAIGAILSGIVCCATVIIGTIGCVSQIRDVALAWFAPRLYVLDYIKELIK